MILVDTSAVVALAEPTDKNHGAAQTAWMALLSSKPKLVTTNYVQAETLAVLQRRLGMKHVRDYL